jgi:hypothetical protein
MLCLFDVKVCKDQSRWPGNGELSNDRVNAEKSCSRLFLVSD